MIHGNLFSRINFNFRLFKHCKEITSLYKKNSLQQCLKIISEDEYSKDLRVSKETSTTYLSKRINLINKLLKVNNCLANSMCLFLAMKNRKNISFIIGVSDDFIEDSFSHCWVEADNLPINEGSTIAKYKPVISIHK